MENQDYQCNLFAVIIVVYIDEVVYRIKSLGLGL